MTGETNDQGNVHKFSRTKTVGAFPDIKSKDERSDDELAVQKKRMIIENILFCLLVFVFEAFIISIYAVWFDYDDENAEHEMHLYPYFRDVNIMIFFGFGFLMTFLRRYGYSAIGYSFLMASLTVQWSLILGEFFENANGSFDFNHRVGISIEDILNGLFCAGAVLISYGAFLGKATPLQMVIMVVIEPIGFWINIFIILFKLQAVDVGGGMTIHVYGCYFGMALTRFLTNKNTRGHPDNCSNYSSDIFSLAGTAALWIMWPSFNAAIAANAIGQQRAVINTFLSIISSTIATFVVRRIVERRFDPVHIQNAILAGGVMMGVAADLKLYPAIAIGCGLYAGILSTLGFRFLTPRLNNWFGLQDICGIHNLHGMPGVSGSMLAVFALIPLGLSYPEEFPRGDFQCLYNFAGLGISIALGLIFGTFAGFLMFLASFVNRIFAEDYYNDRTFWVLPSDYEYVIRHDDDDG